MDRIDDELVGDSLANRAPSDADRPRPEERDLAARVNDADPEYQQEAAEAREHVVNPEFQPGEETFFDELRDVPSLQDTREHESMRGEERRGMPRGNDKEALGESVGAVSGVVAGAAIGSLAGPIGAVIGALAGAVGGWWAGRAVADSVAGITPADDGAYRTHYESSAERFADRTYDDVRPAYHLGHVAADNPEYDGREFDEIEPELRRGWSDDLRERHGEWERVRPYARAGWSLRWRARHERLGGTPRQMSPTERARERLHEDDTGF